jgi:hypothetical protein
MSVSPYPPDEANPDEPSFVQLTRLEPVDQDQQSGIDAGDYQDDPNQVRLSLFCLFIELGLSFD